MEKYKKQKNYCSRLYKKEHQTLYGNLKLITVLEIKTFGGNMQPIFSENRNIANKVTLVDDNELITSGDNQVSEELNTFFQNTIKTLNITEGSYLS